jgi:hypothetical protein
MIEWRLAKDAMGHFEGTELMQTLHTNIFVKFLNDITY